VSLLNRWIALRQYSRVYAKNEVDKGKTEEYDAWQALHEDDKINIKLDTAYYLDLELHYDRPLLFKEPEV
jgi:hypothetical protein